MTLENSGSDWTRDDAETLFARYARTHDPQQRDRLVEMHHSLVCYLAGKFAHCGEPIDELLRVGTIGLINAVDSYAAADGIKFSTYAAPTIVGEIRRYLVTKADL